MQGNIRMLSDRKTTTNLWLMIRHPNQKKYPSRRTGKGYSFLVAFQEYGTSSRMGGAGTNMLIECLFMLCRHTWITDEKWPVDKDVGEGFVRKGPLRKAGRLLTYE